MKRLLLGAVLGSLLLGASGMASAGDNDRWDRKHDRREWRDRDRYDGDRRHFQKHRHAYRHHRHYHPGRAYYRPWKHHDRGGRYARRWGHYDNGVTIIFKGRID